jgi:hypothetical protein
MADKFTEKAPAVAATLVVFGPDETGKPHAS